MDLVESPLFTSPIILLQTVIEEVRHRSLPLYNRLNALKKMDDKRIWTFYNEYRSYVFSCIWEDTLNITSEKLLLFEKKARPRMIVMIEVCLYSSTGTAIMLFRYSKGCSVVQLTHKPQPPSHSGSSPTNFAFGCTPH